MAARNSRKNLSEHALELIASRFKALSEVNRLKLILALRDAEKNVTMLVEETGMTQANVSRHLQVLIDAHILARRKEGLNVVYSIGDPGIFELCEAVCGGIQEHLEKQARAFR
jgi:ArsR family transcriptional regulator